MTDHLGYEPHDPVGRRSGNSRSGGTGTRLLTGVRPIDLEAPWDCNSTFETLLVRNGQRPLDGIDKIVIGLHVRA